ncbi:MAG TPA: SLC13 family permease [Lentibacillus sp.]|uniref:SLC13 family permease n=1 Tax=Lentibacillus sp. TaxID=1925746 RepID=UPI002B4ABC2F|nr:SLC13 family permease [Lentibacillus sp.]HLR63283.1 SLC13 family permease [Lentibacillus sp.]
MATRLDRHKDKKSIFFDFINRFSTRLKVIIAIHILFASFILTIDNLDYAAKVSLFAFLSAMTLWIGTKIPAGYVAVSLIVFIVFMKASEPELLYHSFGEEVIWLMIGAFIIGEAINNAGLADRFSQSMMNRAKNKNFILKSLTYVLCISAFFIPSTSGRAALSMPIIKQLGDYFSDKEKEVLAVIVPVIILMSTSASLIGAGSHLIGVGFLETSTGESISFVQWLIWGAPFAIVISFLSLFIIKLVLWPKEISTDTLHTPMNEEGIQAKQPMSKKERKTILFIIVLIMTWMTETLHGYDIAFITMVGAILFMLPKYGVISWKQGIKSVSWNLILFVAAATALGKVLVDSGVVGWIEKEMIGVLHLFTDASEWLIVLLILIVTVTSHLYITSHTTRAIVFIPSLLLFGQMIGANPVGVVFISLIGMNYCVTFPVSSKALLLFYEEGEVTYKAGDLLKISFILMPFYILVLLLFYFTYWQWTGLSI